MKTLEDKSTDLSVRNLCVCGAGGKRARSSAGVRACFFCECQNKETVQWIFYSTTLLPICTASQCWPLEHAHTHKRTHTHARTCSVSRRSCRLRGSRLHRFLAGATTVQTHLPSGSEAVLYTCQPSSEPGYKPWTQAAAVLREPPGMLRQLCFQEENQWFRVNWGYSLDAFEVPIWECWVLFYFPDSNSVAFSFMNQLSSSSKYQTHLKPISLSLSQVWIRYN